MAQRSRSHCLLALLCALDALACASGPKTTGAAAPHAGAAPSTAPSTPSPAATSELEIPAAPPVAPLARVRIASGLNNPRGMYLLPSGELLVAEAGTGRPEDGRSGRLVRLHDRNGDGDCLDADELQVVLADQPSRNIFDIVRRDEVFGMAGMAAKAEGDTRVLVALAFFGGPSTVFQIDGDRVTQWTTTHGNLNDLAYDPRRASFFAVASTTDEVVRLAPGQGATRVLKLPPMPSGQDAVPAYLRYDPLTSTLLVSLFTGSPEGEEGGQGTEIVPRAGAIIAVDPDARSFRFLVRGLTVPTDLEVGPDGSIYVLEFCDAFLDPVSSYEDMARGPSHGGFKRFSGRLLRVERPSGRVTVLAEGLDAPTNLLLAGGALYIAEGMGTPGREIPGPAGTVALEGFIERLVLPASAPQP